MSILGKGTTSTKRNRGGSRGRPLRKSTINGLQGKKDQRARFPESLQATPERGVPIAAMKQYQQERKIEPIHVKG